MARRPPGPARAMTGATSSARSSGPRPSSPPAASSTVRRSRSTSKGKPSFQLLQATPEGRRRRPRLLRLRPAGRPGRGHRQLPNIERKERLAALLKPPARRSFTATMSSARARSCSTPSARRAARGSSRRRPRRPTEGRAGQELAQDQMHPAAGIRHRRLAGQRQAPRVPIAPPRRP